MPSRAGITGIVTATGVKDKTTEPNVVRPGVRWGRWAIGVGLVLAGLLALLLALPLLVWINRDIVLDSARVRTALLNQAEAALGRRPQWEGALRLDWTIEPYADIRHAVAMSQVVVTVGSGTLPNSDGFSEQPLLAWNQIKVVIDGSALKSLVAGERWHFHEIQVDGLVLQGEQNQLGEYNWAYLFAGSTDFDTPVRLDQLRLPQMALHYQAADGLPFSLKTESAQLDGLQREPNGVWRIDELHVATSDGAELGLSDLMTTSADPTSARPESTLSLRWQVENLALRSLPVHELAVPTWLIESEAPLRVVQATGQLTAGNDGLELGFDALKIDSTAAEGRFLSTLVGPPELRLHLDRLLLDAYLGPAAVGSTAISPADRSPAAISDTLPFDALRSLAWRAEIDIDELAWGQDRIRGLSIQISP